MNAASYMQYNLSISTAFLFELKIPSRVLWLLCRYVYLPMLISSETMNPPHPYCDMLCTNVRSYTFDFQTESELDCEKHLAEIHVVLDA